MVTFCLCNPFMVPQEIFSQPTNAFNDDREDSLHVQGWSLLRPSHRAALVDIHMDAARNDSTHCSSLHPSTLSITAIAQEKVAFGTAAKGRRTYGTVSPPKLYLSEMRSRQNLFSIDALTFTASRAHTMVLQCPVI